MITKNEISSLNLSPTKKDFVQIWNELIEVASKITERWDPTSTNESDPGIVLLKVLTGIADKLNYNIDKNILEAYMPTAAQMESMRKLCELVGYDIKYYQSAETKARISYIGNTTDLTDDNKERLPEPGGLAIPKFTTLTNADKDITFVTTNTVPLLITNITPWVEVPCIEGQISQCESTNEYNLITLAQLDDNNRYYLPETQIAENGIFVYNAVASGTDYIDGMLWEQVSNLNIRSAETRVFKFGYDSFEGRPYLAFPDDIGSLIGDGLFIYFVRTSGLNGNISPRTLEILEVPAGKDWEDYPAELFEVVNVDATTNGANIESISAAYNNFKKTVGTFDTLVTCRDYMNKIYSLMDASNLPYVSNILVTDIRNDINNALTLCSCNEFGILYKETPRTERISAAGASRVVNRIGDSDTYQLSIFHQDKDVPLLDHFDLLLYPFKTFTQVSSSTKDLVSPYNKSFTYTEQMNREIKASLDEFKTCAHNLASPLAGDIVAINNYLRLNALIATSIKVSEIEAESILQNVKVALVNAFNSRNLDFGEEIPFESLLSVIENADSRIKVVSLQEPAVLTTYSVKEQVGSLVASKEYGIASVEADKIIDVNYGDSVKTAKGETAKDIYNKLVLRNILAGRASLFDYEETFIPNNSEKPYTVTRDINQVLDNILKEGSTATTEEKEKARTVRAEINAAVLATLQAQAKSPSADTVDTDSVVVTRKYAAPVNEQAVITAGEHVLDSNGAPIAGLADSGIVTLKIFEPIVLEEFENNPEAQASKYRVYETYKPFDKEILDNVSRVEAVCELSSKSASFENITLDKNEVIKFRAPNLITTKTFPAYVYYRFEKGTNSGSKMGATRDIGGGDTSGSYAECMSLDSLIKEAGEEQFFTKLWELAGEDIRIAKVNNPTEGTGLNQWDEFVSQASTAIGVGVITDDDPPVIYANNLSGLATDLHDYFANVVNSGKEVTLKYYPLNTGTLNIWSDCVRSFKTLPLDSSAVLWRLSSTRTHPKGKLVTNSGQRLYAQDGEHLTVGYVGTNTYICTNLGEDPKQSYVGEGCDMELGSNDKLYIHYTPSSTNADGETVDAEPVSEVYTGGGDEPIILKPSGFTLMPTDAVIQQGTSPKKSVDFGDGKPKDLLALAPNEQIEMRSIARVVLNTPARFYRNFDARELDGNINKTESYELKDGEYIFYTDLNTQEAAYYGSGSVIMLDPGAFIPKPTEIVEISQILEQGLHIIPWSNYVLLDNSRKITITEYQYVTLVAGDTLNSMTLDTKVSAGNAGVPVYKDGHYVVDNTQWTKCINTDENPISYTPAGDTSAVLPKVELLSGQSTSWEVCSFLELSTSAGYAQQLRATETLEDQIQASENTVAISDKLKIYTTSGTGEETEFEVAPQKTCIPASSSTSEDTTKFEPVSIKLSTIAQAASGRFDRADIVKANKELEDLIVHMKVFKEDAPSLIELSKLDEVTTPISAPRAFSVEPNSDRINNHWTKLDIQNRLSGVSTSTGASAVAALNLNFMIPEDSDLFGIFSIYVSVPDDKLEVGSTQHMLKGPYTDPDSDQDVAGCRVFIDVPKEFGSWPDVVSIFNYTDQWWSEGVDSNNFNRLYLRAGLNCLRVRKSCNLLIRAEANATGSILYDNLRLVKGVRTNGVNLALLDPDASFNRRAEFMATITDEAELQRFVEYKETLANRVLDGIRAMDKDQNFYYNVAVENSLAIEFDKNINSFSNPYTLYDINNINNSFVISKLDVAYLDDGLKIAKSSKY